MSIERYRDGDDEERRRRAGRGERNEGGYWELGREAAEAAERVGVALIAVETRLAQLGELLRISQPPMPGKYDVRWWLHRGWLHPVLVRWIKPKGKDRMQVKRVERARYRRSDRGFGLNAEQTDRLIAGYLVAAEAVKRYRSELSDARSRMERVGRALALLDGDMGAMLERTRGEVVENLLNAGYEVEMKYRSLEGITHVAGARGAESAVD